MPTKLRKVLQVLAFRLYRVYHVDYGQYDWHVVAYSPDGVRRVFKSADYNTVADDELWDAIK